MTMRQRTMRSRNVALGASFTALAATLATGVTACGTSDEVLYCGNEQRYIVEADECERDDPSNPYFIYYGYWAGYNYAPGSQLEQNALNGRVRANDADARTKLGVPARGGFGGNGATLSAGG